MLIKENSDPILLNIKWNLDLSNQQGKSDLLCCLSVPLLLLTLDGNLDTLKTILKKILISILDHKEKHYAFDACFIKFVLLLKIVLTDTDIFIWTLLSDFWPCSFLPWSVIAHFYRFAEVRVTLFTGPTVSVYTVAWNNEVLSRETHLRKFVLYDGG